MSTLVPVCHIASRVVTASTPPPDMNGRPTSTNATNSSGRMVRSLARCDGSTRWRH